MTELKKCPFCGKNTVKIIPFDNGKYIISHWYENISYCPIAVADEDTGIGSTYFETEEEAIEVWNNQATEAEIRAKAIDEFAEALYNKSTSFKNIESDDYGILNFEEVYEVAEQMKGGAV